MRARCWDKIKISLRHPAEDGPGHKHVSELTTKGTETGMGVETKSTFFSLENKEFN